MVPDDRKPSFIFIYTKREILPQNYPHEKTETRARDGVQQEDHLRYNHETSLDPCTSIRNLAPHTPATPALTGGLQASNLAENMSLNCRDRSHL